MFFIGVGLLAVLLFLVGMLPGVVIPVVYFFVLAGLIVAVMILEFLLRLFVKWFGNRFPTEKFDENIGRSVLVKHSRFVEWFHPFYVLLTYGSIFACQFMYGKRVFKMFR